MLLVLFLLCADDSLARAIQLTQEKTPASLAEAKHILAQGAFVHEELKQARVLACEIALAEHAAAEFISCAQGLARDYPTAPEALYYGHQGQLASRHYAEARKLLAAARQHGLPEVMYQEAQANLDEVDPSHLKWFVLAGVVVLVGVFLGFKPWRKARV